MRSVFLTALYFLLYALCMKRAVWALLGSAAISGWTVGSAQTVPKALLAEDLQYVVETVSEVHPAFVEAGRRAALADRADALLRPLPDEVPRWRVGVTVAELLRPLDDGHTQTDLTLGSVRYLPLQFAWLSDGLVVAPVTETDDVTGIPVSSEVLEIGGLDTAVLENRSRLIPESKHWVREKGSANLSAEGVLRWLGVVQNGFVTLSIRIPSGEVRTVRVPLSDLEMGASEALQKRVLEARGLASEWDVNGSLFAYKVDAESSYGVFWLKSCDDTDEYRFLMKRFFQTVRAERVGNVVVSVQQNGGGNAGVIHAILGNLSISNRQIRGFSSRVRYSNQVRAYTELNNALLSRGIQDAPHRDGLYFFDREDIPTEPVDSPFGGATYVLTDAGSYSSAIDVAAALSDNGLARIAGEPSGGKPSSYREILIFKTTDLSISFSVSSTYWKRPDSGRDPANTLEPDISLPVTVKDVQTGHSPVLEWLESLKRP